MKKYSSFIKKVLSLLLTAVFCCGMLAGCEGNTASKGSMADWQANSNSNALRVFYTGDKKEIEQAITHYQVQFPEKEIEVTALELGTADYSTILQQMMSRTMAGDGPDVVIIGLPFTNAYDVYKICLAGAFVNLDSYFEKDADWSWDGYNTKVIDSMKIDGKQYIMPLYYDLPVMIGDATALDEMGFDVEKCSTGIGLFAEMKRYMESAAGDETKCSLFPEDTDFIDSYLNLMQINPLDYNTRKLNWSQDYETLLDAYRQYYQSVGTDAENRRDSAEQYLEEQLYYRDFLFLDQNVITPFTEKFHELQRIAAFGDSIMLPIYNADGSGISAQVTTAAGICTGSKHKDEAYDFIKILLSEEVQQQKRSVGTDTYISTGCCPVNKAALQKIWSINGQTYAHGVTLSSGEYGSTELQLPALSQELFDQYMKLTEQINYVYINNASVDVMYYFEKYLKGEQSYEEAFDRADSQLDIYISE